MKADTRTLQGVLHGDRQFIVPVYQRPYVWTQEAQWKPLWDDIESTVGRLAEVRKSGFQHDQDAASADTSAPPHFLGAVVIEQSPTRTGDVETRLVVDGQQRLTTVQLLLRGVLDAVEEVEVSKPLRAKLRKAIRNDADVVPDDKLHKVDPRPTERAEFLAAMADERPDDEGSKFAAARSYFADSARGFLADPRAPEDPYGQGSVLEQRASLLTATLVGLVKLVVIDLEDTDDAQVIFEALNARSTPLSATDLVKNLLFMRARAQHQDPQELYDSLWKRFDDESEWWLGLVGVGHAQRARQDWLLGDWLIAQRGQVINVGRLYGEFRDWLERSGTKPVDALTTLNDFADAYEMLHGRKPGVSDGERLAYQRIDTLNIAAATPLLLWLLVQPSDVLDPAERELTFRAIESYVVRRMATKYQTRAYGTVFAELLKVAQDAPEHPGKAVIAALRDAPHGYVWPSAGEIEDSFREGRYYGPGGINQERLRLLLSGIDARLQETAPKSEPVSIDYGQLQVEHLIPQKWREYWPVAEGEGEARALAEDERERHVNRIGNLTLVTAQLNPSLSNDPWTAKKQELSKHSKLELNARLIDEDDWDETRIDERSLWLAAQLKHVWPGPDAALWEGE